MLKYRGGKTRELDQILPSIPKEYSRYIEPFFGGGAVYFALEPENAIINDVNPKLMGFYKAVQQDYPHLIEEIEELATVYNANSEAYLAAKQDNPDTHIEDPNEELYYRLRDMFNGLAPSEYSDAALYFFINKTAYSGMVRHNKQGEYNVPYGRYKRINPHQIEPQHSKLLQRASIHNDDYSKIFELCEEDDFVFLDPPYDCVFTDYGNGMVQSDFKEGEQRKLRDAFFSLPCKALLVIGKTDLTEELYKGSIVKEYAKNYAVNIRNRFKARSNHILVANY